MSEDHNTRIIVLISGSGTNLQALIDACNNKSLQNCSIIKVISNRKGALGLVRAEKANIPAFYHNLVKYKKEHEDVDVARSKYDEDLAQIILKDKPDLVVCAGWMHILKPTFLNPLAEAGVHVINLHPALPGQFNGANAIERAHKAFMEDQIEKTGVMIHYVISEVDMGEPILVEEIPLTHPEDDDLQTLEQRMHQVEWKAIVKGTRKAILRYWGEKGS